MPPSLYCIVSVLRYYNRLTHLPNDMIVKKVFNELTKLHDMGFPTWIGKVCDLAQEYSIDNLEMDIGVSEFKARCKNKVFSKFIVDWQEAVCNLEKNPLLITYTRIKSTFGFEPYLELVKACKYRTAISKLRASSHILEIQRGRYDRPKKPREERLCVLCGNVEDEEHFVMKCRINHQERHQLFSRISRFNYSFGHLDDSDKFLFLFNNSDQKLLTWFGKFLFNSFKLRAEYHHSISIGS